METYYVVRSTKEMDYEEKSVKATSLNKATAKVSGTYAKRLSKGDTLIVFPKQNHLGFDEHGRLIFPKGDARIIVGRFGN